MRTRIGIFAALAAAAAAGAVGGAAAGEEGGARPEPEDPWAPRVDIVSPRNGAVQTSQAVVVKVKVENFKLAPRRFGGEPQLREGHLRFSLNRVPDCVDPRKLQRALDSPLGKGRLVGASFDYPHYAGPNGILAARIGSSGSYSPGTRPEIYYQNLRPGLYRLVITIAHNSGATTPHHAVTNFQILPRRGPGPKPCPPGKVSSAKAKGLDLPQ
jgi:hypothetical protein